MELDDNPEPKLVYPKVSVAIVDEDYWEPTTFVVQLKNGTYLHTLMFKCDDGTFDIGLCEQRWPGLMFLSDTDAQEYVAEQRALCDYYDFMLADAKIVKL
jgi:hypothetical protein